MIQPFDDTYFMKKALQEAEVAYEKGEIPVGAVIVVEDRIIARTHNLTELLNDVTAHAEMQAITAAANFLGGKYLTKCTLYVTLEPCHHIGRQPACTDALIRAGVRHVVYGIDDPDLRCAGRGAQALTQAGIEVRSGIFACLCKSHRCPNHLLLNPLRKMK